MTEEELAIFDLLTQPDPVLTDEERETVKGSAKKLLEHLHEKLVQDWRRKVAPPTTSTARSAACSTRVCPRRRTPWTSSTTKVQLVFDHVLTAYGDNGESAYDIGPTSSSPGTCRSNTPGLLTCTRSLTTSWPNPRRSRLCRQSRARTRPIWAVKIAHAMTGNPERQLILDIARCTLIARRWLTPVTRATQSSQRRLGLRHLVKCRRHGPETSRQLADPSLFESEHLNAEARYAARLRRGVPDRGRRRRRDR